MQDWLWQGRLWEGSRGYEKGIRKMDERIMNEFVAEMLKLLQSSSQFIGEQMPLVCQEILRYQLVASTGLALLGGGLGIFGYWAYKRLLPTWAGIQKEPPYPHIAAGICYVWALALVIVHLLEVLQILIAPRLFLLTYFSNLVR